MKLSGVAYIWCRQCGHFRFLSKLRPVRFIVQGGVNQGVMLALRPLHSSDDSKVRSEEWTAH